MYFFASITSNSANVDTQVLPKKKHADFMTDYDRLLNFITKTYLHKKAC